MNRTKGRAEKCFRPRHISSKKTVRFVYRQRWNAQLSQYVAEDGNSRAHNFNSRHFVLFYRYKRLQLQLYARNRLEDLSVTQFLFTARDFNGSFVNDCRDSRQAERKMRGRKNKRERKKSREKYALKQLAHLDY